MFRYVNDNKIIIFKKKGRIKIDYLKLKKPKKEIKWAEFIIEISQVAFIKRII